MQEKQGSWYPFLLVAIVLLVRWLYFGQGQVPIRFRRWFHTQVRSFSWTGQFYDNYLDTLFMDSQQRQLNIRAQRIKLRTQLGYRDNSIYGSVGAGQGARASVKRQG